jgi:hypothetical protein
VRTTEQILHLWKEREQRLSPLHKAAIEVRGAYYGDVLLPLPELDQSERPLVANLLLQGGEQKAMRVASTMPDVRYPSSKPGKNTYDQRARDRRLINLAWWDIDKMKLKMRKRARHMVFYAMSPVMLRPNFTDKRPTWQIRNPLTTYAPEMDVGDLTPEDVIFTFIKSFAWLQGRYPGHAAMFGDIQDAIFTVLEYQDADHTVMLAHGQKETRNMYGQPTTEDITVELERVPNRAGRCTAIVPGRIGLEHPRGEFDGVVGLWQQQAKLMALETIGMQRAIWPEEWLVDDPTGDGARIVVHADPLHGVTGHVTGGKLEIVRPDVSQGAVALIDRMERGVRIEGGIPAELGGESTSNIRTGRRGDAVLSAALDFPIQEHQEILAASLQEENKVAIAIDKAYFPTAKSIYLSATSGEIQYQANQVWERDTNFVVYSHAGVDAQQIVVELGQLVGTGLISRRSAMETHPLIDDAQGEFDRMTLEHVRDGLLNGLSTMAQDPQMAPVVARVMMKVKMSEIEVEDAVQMVHEEMQKEQAAAAQEAAQQQQGALPGGPGGPEQQPGMGQPLPTVAAPPQGLTNLTGLLTQLHRGANAGAPV